MAESRGDAVVVVASETEVPATCGVWGTGGWLPPEQREALDWLTLSRLLGWSVTVTSRTRPGRHADLSSESRWIILACDPDDLGEESVAILTSRLSTEPILVVARAGAENGAFARLAGAARRPEQIAGRSLGWIGPGPSRSWCSGKALNASALVLSEGVSTWATLEGVPLIAARRVGRGLLATLGFHPSQARDTDGACTALLTHLLICGPDRPVAWLDLEGSLVLRMDDAGGAQSVFLGSWSHPKLGDAEWAAIGADLLRRRGRMSIGYVAGWVDDGDAARGTLQVAGHAPHRVPGKVYPSPLVRYQDLAGHAPGTLHDYEAEFRGIQALRAAGLGDVELHGYSHMHPDGAVWARALDRYAAEAWYRELGSAAEATIAARPPDEHPLALGIASLRRYFEVHPTTLICPGDQWTNQVLERALDLGLSLVSSYYLALRDGDRFCWSTHVCAPYLDDANPGWFHAGLPVVGYFHDRDPMLHGVEWMSRCLDRWQTAGAKKLLDFRELAAALGRRLCLEERYGELRLTVTGDGAPALVRPLTIAIRLPGVPLPSKLEVSLDDADLSLEVHPLGDGLGHVTLPCSTDGPTLR
jgi:hypothetical protein